MITERTVDLFGTSIRYLDGGPEDGPVVVLIHGLGSTCREWGPALPLLADRVRVLALDLPGHGESYAGRGDYSLGAFANAVRDLLDHLGVDRATLVGHSMGGGVAMMFTYQYPDRVRDIVLVSAGGLGPEVTPLLRASTIPGGSLGLKLLGSRGVEAVMRTAMRTANRISRLDTVGMDQLTTGFAAFRNTGVRSAFQATARSMIDRKGQRVDATTRLPLTRGRPLLLIHGDRDRFIPIAHSRNAHAMVPGSRFEIFPRSGHYPHLNHPARFADLVLAQVAASAAV